MEGLCYTIAIWAFIGGILLEFTIMPVVIRIASALEKIAAAMEGDNE